MRIIGCSPSGIVLEPFTEIRIDMEATDDGLMGSKVTVSATSPFGVVLLAIYNSTFQPGWAGTILPSPAAVLHSYLTVIITTWPPEITSPATWEFSVHVFDSAGD